MLDNELRRIPGLQLFPVEPLARHTRFALGGPARLLADSTSLASLHAALTLLRQSGHPFLLIGGGTNLIVADSGFDGIVLRYRGASLRHHLALFLQLLELIADRSRIGFNLLQTEDFHLQLLLFHHD